MNSIFATEVYTDDRIYLKNNNDDFMHNSNERDIDNPKSNYHKWLNSGKKISREDIINKKNVEKGLQNTNSNVFVINNTHNSNAFIIHNTRNSNTSVINNTHNFNASVINNTRNSNASVINNTRNSNASVINNTRDFNTSVINNTRNYTDSIIFNKLTELNWRDKSEGFRSIQSIKKYDVNFYKSIFKQLIKLADDLYKVIYPKNIGLEGKNNKTKYNFLFHVLTKGEEFYLACLTDPDFCIYLYPDEYQDLYEYICCYIGIMDYDNPLNGFNY